MPSVAQLKYSEHISEEYTHMEKKKEKERKLACTSMCTYQNRK